MVETKTEVATLKAEVTSMHEGQDRLERKVDANHLEIKAELQTLTTAAVTRDAAYNATIGTIKDGFVRKDELTAALAPMRRIGWIIITGIVTMVTGLFVTVVGGVVLFLVTR